MAHISRSGRPEKLGFFSPVRQCRWKSTGFALNNNLLFGVRPTTELLSCSDGTHVALDRARTRETRSADLCSQFFSGEKINERNKTEGKKNIGKNATRGTVSIWTSGAMQNLSLFAFQFFTVFFRFNFCKRKRLPAVVKGLNAGRYVAGIVYTTTGNACSWYWYDPGVSW